MKRAARIFAFLAAAAGATAAFGAGPAPKEEVDGILGVPGKDLPGDVRKYSWPRTDLQVDVGGIRIEPPLALGSWAAFHGAAKEAEVMGDLALLGTEVAPVARSLEAGGFEILALHNHLIGESPRIVYLHYGARGAAPTLARALRSALEKSATPLAPAPAPATPSPEAEKMFARVQDALGRRGSMAGRVLQVGVPRKETIRDAGMEVPASMGMAESLNFETAGDGVATTGDFVLTADEVAPVIRSLHAGGVEVTALHSHMLRETPRLFFLHFWGVGSPEAVGAALRSALSKIAVAGGEGAPRR
ncbi:MAG TPA: DUF1259 domain-containing protein [Thermoanaerobaculia bacterium]